MIIVLCNIERKERNWSKRRREYRVLRLQGVTTFPAFSRRSSSAGLEILLNQYPNWPKRLVCKRAWTRTYAVSRNIQASVETLAGIERYAISRVLLPCSFVYLHNSRWWPVIKTHTPRRVCTSPSFLSSPSVASIQHDVTFFYITKLHFQSLLTAFHLAPRNFKLYAPVPLYIVKILSLYICSRVWNIFRYVNFVTRLTTNAQQYGYHHHSEWNSDKFFVKLVSRMIKDIFWE